MITQGRNVSDISIYRSQGGALYSNFNIIVASGKVNTTAYKLIAPLDDLKALPHYRLPSTQYVYIASTNANDNSSGTGARTIQIVGLDSTGQAQLDLVNTNGQTAVQSNLEFSQVFELAIPSFGSNTDSDTGDSVSHGNIWCGTGAFTNGVPANKIVGIKATDNDPNSRVGIYTTKADKITFVKEITAFVESSEAIKDLVQLQIALNLPLVGDNFYAKLGTYQFLETFQYNFTATIPLPPLTNIEIRARSNKTVDKNVTIYLTIEEIDIVNF